MVTPEELAALDLLIWLGTGQLAARTSHCHQSTISRRLARATGAFRLKLRRCRGEWQVLGDLALLAMERELHQLCRFLGHQPLRLEIEPSMVPLVAQSAPPGWIRRSLERVDPERPRQLLRERVIDVLVTGCDRPFPGEDPAELLALPLHRPPLRLAGSRAPVGMGRQHAPFHLRSQDEPDSITHGELSRPHGMLVCRRDVLGHRAIEALRAEIADRLHRQAPGIAQLDLAC